MSRIIDALPRDLFSDRIKIKIIMILIFLIIITLPHCPEPTKPRVLLSHPLALIPDSRSSAPVIQETHLSQFCIMRDLNLAARLRIGEQVRKKGFSGLVVDHLKTQIESRV